MAVLLLSMLAVGSFAAKLSPRIVNGLPTLASNYPFIVDVRVDVDSIDFGNFSWGNYSWGNYSWGNYSWGNYSWGNYSWGNYSWGNDSATTWSPSNYSTSTSSPQTTASSDSNHSLSASMCSGSLVELCPATVLTAAHCVYQYMDYLDYYVYLSRTDQDGNFSATNNYSLHKVSHIEVFPRYSPWNQSNDIALMFLDEDLSSDGRLGVVTLNDGEDFNLTAGADLQVIGYGADVEGGNATDTLEYADQYFVTRTECENLLNAYFNATLWNYTDQSLPMTMICAMGNDSDSCQGDSGGPLIVTGTTKQVGVTSWGIGCNRGLPGVYAKVSLYADWIYETIEIYENMTDWMDCTDSSSDSSDGISGDGSFDDEEGDGVGSTQFVLGVLIGAVAVLMK